MQIKNMHISKKSNITATIVLALTLILVVVPFTSAVASVTLSPTTAAAGSTITVSGTGFGATKAVGVGFGAEVTVTGEVGPTPTGTGTGPYYTATAHRPIKPGSLNVHWDTSGTESDYADNGDGTLSSSSQYAAGANVNYVTGVFNRSSTTDLSTYTLTATFSYTYYQYNVTPASGITTSGSGTFNTSIIIPAVAMGTYNITAIDAVGNKNTAPFIVNAVVPEGISIGVMLIASLVAMVVGSRYLKKRPATTNK